MYGIGLNGSLLLGTQSLNTQQIAISTIGNNIANVNTPGYARQRVNLVTDVTTGAAGEQDLGASISSIESLRSPLLDSLVQQALGNQGYADNQSNLTSTVQDALGEQFTASGSSSSSSTTTTGSGAVQDALSTFFSAMQSLASTPSDPTARQLVVQDAQALSTAINGAYQRVQQTQSQIGTDASTITTQINNLSKSIASLNQQITQVESASGATANDLRDTRAADINTLAGLVNITTTAQSNGSINVSLADAPSVTLVNDTYSGGASGTQTLSVAYNASASVPLTVSASSSGALGTGVPSSGTLGSDLNVANEVIGSPGTSGDTGLLGSLDTIANQLRTQMNAQNAAGYDLSGNKGGAFFTGTGAADLAVSAGIVSNPSLIAAGNGTGTLDGSNAVAMANLQNSPTIVPAFQTMVANLGETVSAASTNSSTQDQITAQLQKQQDSVSGVSIDEEMTNLINFQQAYDASARFITTISGLYDTLVNHTGT